MKTILCRGFRRSINGFHRMRSSSSRQRFLIYHILLRHTTFRKLTCFPQFSIDSATSTVREEGNGWKHEISNITTTLELFERVCENDDFTCVTLHPVVQDCIRVLPCMNKEEYVRLIGILLVLKEKFANLYDCDDNMIRLSKPLDDILRDWLSQREPEDVLNALRMSKVLVGHSTFTIDVIKKLRKVFRWPTHLMLQYVQHMNENHFWNIYHVDKYDVEYTLSQHLPYLNIDQTAIVMRALNELKVDITSPELPRKLFELFLRQHSWAKQSTISVFVKFFSRLVPCFWDHSYNIHTLLPDIVGILNQHVDSWPLDTIVEFASFCRRITSYDDVFFQKLVRRMLSDDVLHLKPDMIDKLIYAIVYFNGSGHYTEELARFIKLLKVEPVNSCFKKHPKRLVSVINNLSKVGVYDEYFLEIIFSNGFLVDTYKKLNPHHVSVNVYSLDQNVQAECANYDGRRLDGTLRRLFEKRWYAKVSYFLGLESSDDRKYLRDSKQASAHERLLYEMRPILQQLLGEECVHLCYMHPHLPRMNFIFALKDDVPQNLSQNIKKSDRLLPMELNKEYDWYTFKFLTPNTLPAHEPLLLYNGINSARLLTKMGINLISFVGKNWKSMAKDEKSAHLRTLIFAKS